MAIFTTSKEARLAIYWLLICNWQIRGEKYIVFALTIRLFVLRYKELLAHLLLHYIWNFLNTLHTCVLSYEESHNDTAVLTDYLGTAYPSGAHEFILAVYWVCIVISLVFSVMLFVLFLFTFVLLNILYCSNISNWMGHKL